MNARCETCGSPVHLNHDRVFACTRDASHGEERALGGVGSGIKGHITERHNKAADAHERASAAHLEVSKQRQNLGNGKYAGHQAQAGERADQAAKSAHLATRVASAVTSAAGANPFAGEAAAHYAKEGNHAEAAKMHASAAAWHRSAGKVMGSKPPTLKRQTTKEWKAQQAGNLSASQKQRNYDIMHGKSGGR